MDPNEALRIIRATIKQMAVEDKTPIQESADLFSFVQHARDLAATVTGLDEWLSKDGFLPADWMAEEDKPLQDAGLDDDHRLIRKFNDDEVG
jgi:hypothetical protein